MEKFNLASLVFFIGGFIVPILVMIAARFILNEPIQISKINDLSVILGLVCEVFAIFFGVLSWKSNISKFIVITVIVLIIGLFALLLMPASSPSRLNQSPQTPSAITPK